MKKERVFTFKTDEELGRMLDNLPNKSEFIRHAIEDALGKRCPLCDGTGAISPAQQEHMEKFLSQHPLERCDECDAIHFVCPTDGGNPHH